MGWLGSLHRCLVVVDFVGHCSAFEFHFALEKHKFETPVTQTNGRCCLINPCPSCYTTDSLSPGID